MASSFSSPPTLPDPNALTTGRAILSGPFVNLADSHNYAHAEGGCAPLVSQEWAGSILAYSGAKAEACLWRVPQISSGHTSLECEVYAEATGAGGVVYFRSENSGNEVSVAVGAAGYYAPGALGIGTPGAGYDDIRMRVQAGGGETITVHAVTIRAKPLGSPLAAGKVDGFTPLGQTAEGPDYPLPAARGVELVGNLSALLARPRMLLCWSAVDSGLGSDAPASMPEMLRRSGAPQTRGARADGAVYTVHVRYRPDNAEATTLRVLVGDPADHDRVPERRRGVQIGERGVIVARLVEVAEKELAAGAALPDWASTTFTLPPEVYAVGDISHPWLRVGVWPFDEVGGNPADISGHPLRSNAELLSVSVWGP